MAKHLVKSSSAASEPQRPRALFLLVGMLIGSTMAVAAAAGGCSSSDGGTSELTEAEAKAFLDDFAPEYTRMTREMFNRALVGHTESAIVSKEHQISDFSVACPGGGTIDFTVESVSVPTASVNGSPNFVANATSTNCRILVWEIEVMGILPTTLEVIPDGHQVDSSGTLRVKVPAGNREFNVEVRELTATITNAGTCYSAVIILGGPTRIEGGNDTSCHEPTSPMPDGGMPDGGTVPPPPECPGQSVEFTDDEFVLSDWTAEAAREQDPGVPCENPTGPPEPGTMCFRVRQAADGGNTGAYRQFDMYNGGAGSIAVKHLKTGPPGNPAVYDPASSGAVTGIKMGFDVFGGKPFSSLETAFSMVVEQDGKLYWTERILINDSQSWFSKNDWTEADFRLYPQAEVMTGVNTPDFSVEGAPLTFGFISAVTGERENNGVDNWLVRVCQ
jgi:hypothetical protein